MKTLRELYADLIAHKCRWSYYNNPPRLDIETLYDENDSYYFIRSYFSCAGKETLFRDPYLAKNEMHLKQRSSHIISTYLLGIIIAESFEFDLLQRDINNANFLYLWFLACLYHDVGYIYEINSCCKDLRDIQSEGLDALQRICGIKHPMHKFEAYSRKDLNAYLSYRATCKNGKVGVIDHGIAGGLILYDRLRKNYEQARGKARRAGIQDENGTFDYGGLHFEKSHYSYYEKAADAIIAHNIWHSTLKECLSKDRNDNVGVKKISRTNQIAFILALADTIEPIKKYGSYSLEKISYQAGIDGFQLAMPNNGNMNTYSYIDKLSEWVDVEIRYICDNEYIKFKIQ